MMCHYFTLYGIRATPKLSLLPRTIVGNKRRRIIRFIGKPSQELHLVGQLISECFWCLPFFTKNEQKQVNLRYHSGKVEFVRSFFGRIGGLKKALKFV